MPRFQPSFSLWPRPQFLGESSNGFASWLARRDPVANVEGSQQRARSVKGIIEDHHDRHSHTIKCAKRAANA
jgi:hypothetical protein